MKLLLERVRQAGASSSRASGLIIICAFVSLSAVFAIRYAHAATTYTVMDTGDGAATPSHCPGVGCRLRDALAAVANGDVIDFSVTGTITLTSGQLVVDKSITITGPGANLLSVNGNASGRVFYINSGKTVSISGLTITNGTVSDNSGGGIYNDHAALTLTNCAVVGNSVIATTSGSVAGGGVFNDGESGSAMLTIKNSTFSGNSVGGEGGGVLNGGFQGSATLTVTNSTFSGNSADLDGGGVYNDGALGSATLTVTNSTFSGNSAGVDGGGIYNDGNSGSATLTLGSTILKTGASGPNISNSAGTVKSLGYNLSSDDESAFLNQTGDQNSTDPMLGPLENNGGPTQTHELLVGSPAIDAGDPNFTPPPNYDQRGAPFARVVNGRIDIGAFEVQPCAEPPSGLIDWWPADGNAHDIKGSNDGTLENGASFAVGKVGEAFSLSGSNQYVDVGSVNLPSTFTIDAWINPTDFSSQPMIVNKDDGITRSYYFEIGSSGQFGAEVITSAGDNQYLSASGAVVTNTWQHVAMTYDGSAGPDQKIKFYVNGALVPATHNGSNDNGGTPNATSLSTKIGINGDTSSFPFSGEIDEVEMFDRVLSQAEIQSIFNAGGTGKCRTCTAQPPNMISWWKAEGDANDSVDSNNGTAQGATFNSGKVGQAFSFDATDDYVSIPFSQSLAIGNAMTYDAWVLVNAQVASYQTLFDNLAGPSATFTNGMLITIPNNSNTLALYVSSDTEYDVANFFDVGQFTHVAITTDGGVTNVYKNGTLFVTLNTPSLVATTSGTNFGARTNGGGQYFGGLIDEVEIFDRALSAAEVRAIADAGSAGKCEAATSPGVEPVSYWISHPGKWCLSKITLGCKTYTKSKAIAIMQNSASNDATYRLAAQLAAAKLNTKCRGTNRSCVSSALTAAHNWLCNHPVGSGVSINSNAWQKIKPTYNTLTNYNSGSLCAPPAQ
jgi:hypothetical protein